MYEGVAAIAKTVTIMLLDSIDMNYRLFKFRMTAAYTVWKTINREYCVEFKLKFVDGFCASKITLRIE